MRVSTKTFQLTWLNSFNARQTDLANIQRQVSSGRKVATAADDPAGVAQLTLLQQGLKRLDAYSTSAETARRRLSVEENVLDDVTDTLNRVRELAIQGRAGKLPTESRLALANEARELRTNLIGLANTQDGEGNYVFAGNRVNVRPFTESGGSVIYNGDDGTRSQRIGDNRVISEGDPGSRVFAAIRNGNGTYTVTPNTANSGTSFYNSAVVADPAAWVPDNYTIDFPTPDSYEIRDGSGAVIATGAFASDDTITFNGIAVEIGGTPSAGDSYAIDPSANQDIFATLDGFITAMSQDSELNSVLLDIDQALANIDVVRSSVGARLAVIDEQNNTNLDLSIQMEQTLSTIRDVDYAAAISELEEKLLGLEAAQRSYARTQSLSLFELL